MKNLDNVQMTVSGTPGAGDVTLGSASAKYQSFASAGAAVGDKTTVRFDDTGNAWELSDVTYASGPSLTGRTLISSSTGSLLSLTSAAIVSAVVMTRDLIPAGVFAHANLGGL